MSGNFVVYISAFKFGLGVVVLLSFVIVLYYLSVFIGQKITRKKDAALPKKFYSYLITLLAGSFLLNVINGVTTGKYIKWENYDLPGGITISAPLSPQRESAAENIIREQIGDLIVSLYSYKAERGGVALGASAVEYIAPSDPQGGVQGAFQMAFTGAGEAPPLLVINDIYVSGMQCRTARAGLTKKEIDMTVIACGEGNRMWMFQAISARSPRWQNDVDRFIESIKIAR